MFEGNNEKPALELILSSNQAVMKGYWYNHQSQIP